MEKNNSNSLKGKIIYHYCSPESFLKIIESKCIWLCATNNMNDYSEGLWAFEAFQRAIKNSNQFSDDDIDKLIFLYQTNNKTRYISCFSEERDSLSQWRAYSQDGEGVSIGFNVNKMDITCDAPATQNVSPMNSIVLSKVDYYDLNNLEQFIFNFLDLKNDKINVYYIDSNKIYHLTSHSPLIKNPAFKEEKEARIIYSPIFYNSAQESYPAIINPLSGEKIKYRISSGRLSSYFEYKIKKTAICEIVLGPKNKFTNYDLDIFLKMHDLSHAAIIYSSATYR